MANSAESARWIGDLKIATFSRLSGIMYIEGLDLGSGPQGPVPGSTTFSILMVLALCTPMWCQNPRGGANASLRLHRFHRSWINYCALILNKFVLEIKSWQKWMKIWPIMAMVTKKCGKEMLNAAKGVRIRLQLTNLFWKTC